jgi:hypothetical protein
MTIGFEFTSEGLDYLLSKVAVSSQKVVFLNLKDRMDPEINSRIVPLTGQTGLKMLKS